MLATRVVLHKLLQMSSGGQRLLAKEKNVNVYFRQKLFNVNIMHLYPALL